MTRIVFTALLVILIALGSGRGCRSVAVHPSHNATYISGESCIISVDVPATEFEKLADWCVTLKKDGR